MIILAAWCLVAGHPGFVFKDGATLANAQAHDAYSEPKNVSGYSSGENNA